MKKIIRLNKNNISNKSFELKNKEIPILNLMEKEIKTPVIK